MGASEDLLFLVADAILSSIPNLSELVENRIHIQSAYVRGLTEAGVEPVDPAQRLTDLESAKFIAENLVHDLALAIRRGDSEMGFSHAFTHAAKKQGGQDV